MSVAQEYHLTAEAETTALQLLSSELALSGADIKRAAEHGCVWWQRGDSKPVRIRRLKKPLRAGDVIHCYYDHKILSERIEPALCIADEGDFSVWLKPRGMFSQGTRWGDANSISRFVEVTLSRPTWLVHRLDRMTAGLIILSHKKSLVAVFQQAFSEQKINKHYLALVGGQPPEWPLTLNQPLAGKAAETEIIQCWHCPDTPISLLAIRIKTGRKHQIRQHLDAIDCAVIGDRLYGEPHRFNDADLQLVSWQLAFDVPTNGGRHSYHLSEAMLQELFLPESYPLLAQAVSTEAFK